MVKRRSFLAGILAAGVAPAFVRSGVLMPVKQIWVPPVTDMKMFRRVVADLRTNSISHGEWFYSGNVQASDFDYPVSKDQTGLAPGLRRLDGFMPYHA